MKTPFSSGTAGEHSPTMANDGSPRPQARPRQLLYHSGEADPEHHKDPGLGHDLPGINLDFKEEEAREALSAFGFKLDSALPIDE